MKNVAPRIIAVGAVALLLFLWGRLLFDAASNPAAMFNVIVDYVVIPSLVLSGIIFLAYGVYKASKGKRSN